MLPLFSLSLIFSVLMCVHAVRTGRELYWLMIIIMLQPVGGLVYLFTQFLPDAAGSGRVRRMGQAARETLDPTKAYRQAKAACDDSPTVGNRMRLAQAAFGLNRYDEAEQLFREAAQGIHEDDEALLMGRAQCLVELGRHEEALTVLNRLGELGDKGRTPQAALALARAQHALGRTAEADTAYAWAAERLPGLEASSRYAVFLNDTGRTAEAREMLNDLDKRLARATTHFRREARLWRDFAAERIGKA
ncbi:MAG: tetratricopeptide repeat protein [Alphaproteobacteria bacterium]